LNNFINSHALSISRRTSLTIQGYFRRCALSSRRSTIACVPSFAFGLLDLETGDDDVAGNAETHGAVVRIKIQGRMLPIP
jgi:hypothetical protein